MAEYKNSIMLGIQLEDSQSAEGKLKTIIENLNKNKVNLDINIKDSNVAKQLESLTNLANDFKKSLGGNITLGDIDKTINQATTSMERLNTEVLKTRTVLNQDGTGNRYSDIANGIGIVTKQTEILNDKTKQWELTEQGKTTTIVNNQKIKQTLEDIANAQERLNNLEARGNINSNQIDLLKNNLSGAYENINGKNDIYKSSEINTYLNQVKALEDEEKNNIQLANQIQDAWDKTYQQRVIADKKAIEQIETNENKAYEQEILRLGEQSIAEQKTQENLINAMANGREKSELKSQQTNRTNELNQAKAINQALEEEYVLKQKLQQEETELIQKQEQAYQQIKTLSSNKIINDSEINKLKELVNSASTIKEINSALSSIGQSASRESSISSLTKQINETELSYKKLLQTFGDKLPDNFKSIDSELKNLKEDLKNVDGNNFTGIKNGLGTIKNEMNEAKNSAQQLTNAMKESNNGGFFSSISNFLGKTGLFYGTYQVVQEITNQLKEATQYTIEMDSRMSAMQMITGKTREEITQVTSQFKDLASQLHETNTNIMAGAEELMRAGYDTTTTNKMLEASTMASKISGQTNEATTSQLIAIKNAYNMTGDQMQHVIDTMSKLDNSSSTSFKEISDAIMRTAYSASQAGTSFDTLSAYITTVSEKTRRSAETINNKLVA